MDSIYQTVQIWMQNSFHKKRTFPQNLICKYLAAQLTEEIALLLTLLTFLTLEIKCEVLFFAAHRQTVFFLISSNFLPSSESYLQIVDRGNCMRLIVNFNQLKTDEIV